MERILQREVKYKHIKEKEEKVKCKVQKQTRIGKLRVSLILQLFSVVHLSLYSYILYWHRRSPSVLMALSELYWHSTWRSLSKLM